VHLPPIFLEVQPTDKRSTYPATLWNLAACMIACGSRSRAHLDEGRRRAAATLVIAEEVLVDPTTRKANMTSRTGPAKIEI